MVVTHNITHDASTDISSVPWTDCQRCEYPLVLELKVACGQFRGSASDIVKPRYSEMEVECFIVWQPTGVSVFSIDTTFFSRTAYAISNANILLIISEYLCLQLMHVIDVCIFRRNTMAPAYAMVY